MNSTTIIETITIPKLDTLFQYLEHNSSKISCGIDLISNLPSEIKLKNFSKHYTLDELCKAFTNKLNDLMQLVPSDATEEDYDTLVESDDYSEGDYTSMVLISTNKQAKIMCKILEKVCSQTSDWLINYNSGNFIKLFVYTV